MTEALLDRKIKYLILLLRVESCHYKQRIRKIGAALHAVQGVHFLN